MQGTIMADPSDTEDEPPKKKLKLPMILSLLLAMTGGGGGFYAVSSGILFSSESHTEKEHHDEPSAIKEMSDVAFVPVDPLVISLSPGSHLRFRAQLEVRASHKSEVELLMPRVVDVLNGYLRALDPGDLEQSSILVRVRAQMLRRIQLVTGGNRVSDLLIMEFVLN